MYHALMIMKCCSCIGQDLLCVTEAILCWEGYFKNIFQYSNLKCNQ